MKICLIVGEDFVTLPSSKHSDVAILSSHSSDEQGHKRLVGDWWGCCRHEGAGGDELIETDIHAAETAHFQGFAIGITDRPIINQQNMQTCMDIRELG